MASVAPQAAPSPPPPPPVTHDPTSFYGNDLSALPIADHGSMPQPALSEIWKAADLTGRADLPSASKERQYAAWEGVVDRLNAGRSILKRFHNPGAGGANADIMLTDDSGSPVFGAPTPDSLEQRAWLGVVAARQADSHAFADLPATLDDFRATFIPKNKAQLAAARETLSRNDSWLGSGTALASGIVTSFRNPINIASLAYGGGEATIAKRVLGMAIANAAAEAVSQPFAARERAKIGETLTPGEAAVNVGAAFVGGGLLAGAGEVIAPGLSRLAAEARARLGNRMTPVESASANLLDRDAEVHATSPFTPGAGTEQHAQRLDDARQVLNTAPQEALNAVPRPAATSYADVPFASVKGRIQGGESRGDYNVVVYGEKAPKPITSMSLGEVFDFQRGPLRDRTRGRRGDGDVGSTGVGAYQFESRTLEQNARALYGDKWRDVQFSPATQDALAEHLWNSVRGKPGMLANTWATFGSKREAGAPVLRRDQFANDEEWASVSI